MLSNGFLLQILDRIDTDCQILFRLGEPYGSGELGLVLLTCTGQRSGVTFYQRGTVSIMMIGKIQ